MVTFGRYVLEDEIPDPQGPIPCTILPCPDPQMTVLLFLLRAGMQYPPQSHDRRVEVVFLEGSGRFAVGNKTFEYRANSRFTVEAGELHQFQRMYTNTFFVKKWRETARHSATVR